ncbi:MAG: hypothetical protein COU35_04525 [Candidatus Magasanikbacteria bacterium CG10_big_fil_rev_8_21_14_0_10_47_10]|uniref:Uncharacterized protein n=1 Tax=Candidatus Magasanikbacteria bacterium CG10_big_fil_rev_8_21_14_0_10_47_10 TaxID=1974652 RepID=A0A2H0TPI4_9BACT|nr:MAG: hypothetical protein COU35_04525 [Candidatus Magasanikbacteria bacterium CG10_big_fil_rev_8_21_14_0_10_47_10]
MEVAVSRQKKQAQQVPIGSGVLGIGIISRLDNTALQNNHKRRMIGVFFNLKTVYTMSHMSSKDIRQKAVTIIATHFGESMAGMYRHFYVGKSDELILTSLTELLTEYLGQRGAEQELEKYSLNKIICN